MISLSAGEARRVALNAQRIHRESDFGRGIAGCSAALEHLGYIQIDTISVVLRAHHHTLWNRVPDYDPAYLERLVEEGQAFEYWSHAAAYLPMTDFKYSLIRKEAISSGEKHWYEPDTKVSKEVLARVSAEGPLLARDFEDEARIEGAWGGVKPAKRALEQLFMEGKLMIVGRQGFQKVYDLAERVLPNNVDTTYPSRTEYLDYLIFGYLRAHGLANSAQMSYLLKGVRAEVEQRCRQLCEDNQLIEVSLANAKYYADINFETVMKMRSSQSKIKILSPFDNLVIQRQRLRELFDYDYQIECYVPQTKRKYGYFCLPLLQGQRFVGRLDAKVDRKQTKLHISAIFLDAIDEQQWLKSWSKSMLAFLQINSASNISIDYLEINGKQAPASLKRGMAEIM